MRDQEQLYIRRDCQHERESRSSSKAVEAANKDERGGAILEQ
jgi:hypothetical protein